jgi:hypothetical protein
VIVGAERLIGQIIGEDQQDVRLLRRRACGDGSGNEQSD